MQIRLSRKAQKYYERAPKNLQNHFDECFEDIAKLNGDIVRLKGSKFQFRYKTYHYRIIFEIDIERNEIQISDIGPRGDIY